MPFAKFLTFDMGSISDGSSVTKEKKADKNYIIKRIYVLRKDGQSFTESTVYFKVEDNVYTSEVVPAVTLGVDKETAPILDIPWNNGQVFTVTLYNNEGSAIEAWVVLELHTA